MKIPEQRKASRMNTDNLQFIFTPDGFYVDTASINTENERQELAIWQDAQQENDNSSICTPS